MKCWEKYISGQTEWSVFPCALFAFCVQVQDLYMYNCIAFFINDQLGTKWFKNTVMGLSMKVLKNTDEDRGLKLKFQCLGYIYIFSYVFINCICQKKSTKNGCGFIVDGGGDAGECWHQRQPAGPHWPDPAMFGFVKQCWMYVLLRSYMSACYVSVSLSVCLCLLCCLQ